MRKVISNFAYAILLVIGSAGVCHAEPIIGVYESPFQTPIDISQLDKIDEDIIFANYQQSNQWFNNLTKVSPTRDVKSSHSD